MMQGRMERLDLTLTSSPPPSLLRTHTEDPTITAANAAATHSVSTSCTNGNCVTVTNNGDEPIVSINGSTEEDNDNST